MANIKISELPEASSFSATDQIPIVSGGATKRLAGATLDGYINNEYIEPIQRNVLGLQGTILWTNPNPTSSFSSQNITLSSSDYDILEVYSIQANSNTRVQNSKIIKGYDGMIYTIFDTGATARRTLTRISDTSYTVGSVQGDSGYDGNNSYIIPIYVIGYKTGLF